MSTRILGGSLKGRLLKSPTGPLARPTTSIMRKSVFDICQTSIVDARFLDLFACSGAMGIEALSRGAAHATFIEKDRKTFHLLTENLKALKLQDTSTALLGDTFSKIKKLSSTYDIIYLDPPYPLYQAQDKPVLSLLMQIDQSSLMSDSCTVFIEEGTPGILDFEKIKLEHLKHKSTRQFGSSLLHQLIYSK